MPTLEQQLADLQRFKVLNDLRAQAPATAQASLAPDEHLQYAEGLTREDPLNALGLGLIAAPGYYLAKQAPFIELSKRLGLIGQNATPGTLGQLGAAYRGIGRGLIGADWSNTGGTLKSMIMGQ
jgi:hypothetical protein